MLNGEWSRCLFIHMFLSEIGKYSEIIITAIDLIIIIAFYVLFSTIVNVWGSQYTILSLQNTSSYLLGD